MRLRPYVPADEAAILDVWERSARHAYPFCDESFFARGRHDLQHVFLSTAHITVCDLDGEVVGFIAMLADTVGGLFVLPTHMRKGYGPALLDHVAMGRDAMDLDVFTKNETGRRFYARYGFREHGPRSLDPVSGEELVAMRWKRDVDA